MTFNPVHAARILRVCATELEAIRQSPADAGDSLAKRALALAPLLQLESRDYRDIARCLERIAVRLREVAANG